MSKSGNKLIILLIILAMAVSVAALTACSGGNKEEAAEPEEETVTEEAEPEEEPEPEEEGEKKVDTDIISINTQSSIRIEGSKTVYLDPYKRSKESHDADLVMITHSHYDHLDPASIKNVSKEDTVFVCPKSMKGELEPLTEGRELITMEAYGEVRKEDLGIEIYALPAYNVEKEFHKKSFGWLAYQFKLDGVTYFDAGDTDGLEEFTGVKADIAFLPIGGTYTMNAKEAASLANAMEPRVLIPIHYGSIVGSKADVDTLKADLDDDIELVTKVKDAR